MLFATFPTLFNSWILNFPNCTRQTADSGSPFQHASAQLCSDGYYTYVVCRIPCIMNSNKEEGFRLWHSEREVVGFLLYSIFNLNRIIMCVLCFEACTKVSSSARKLHKRPALAFQYVRLHSNSRKQQRGTGWAEAAKKWVLCCIRHLNFNS